MQEKEVIVVSCVYTPEPLVSARMSEDIAKYISNTDNVTVLCPPPTRPIGSNYTRAEIHKGNYNVITLQCYTNPKSSVLGRLRESYSFGKAVVRYVKKNSHRIKCIYANTHPTIGQYLLINAAKKYNIPCIIHIQDLYPESLTSKLGVVGRLFNPIFVSIDGHYMRKASKLITISPNMKETICHTRFCRPEFVNTVYNWQDETTFNTAISERHGCFKFMFVGTLNPTASLITVINAFGLANIDNSQLILAGDGSDKENCKNIAKLYPKAQIKFTSILPNDVPKIQAQADVLILSLRKGISHTALPSKLPAYMFSSKPIIASVDLDSDLADIIDKSKCGWIVQAEDVKQLSQQLTNCTKYETDELKKMGANGRQYAVINFSKTENLKKMGALIYSAMH